MRILFKHLTQIFFLSKKLLLDRLCDRLCAVGHYCWFYNFSQYAIWLRGILHPLHINSSFIKTSPILKVLRLYKIVITIKSLPNGFRGWGSVRPTICDQAQVDHTLHLGVRAQNEGKFELFVVTSTLT